VQVRPLPGAISVQVADTGVGGADPHGDGLAGLADRVRALGGELKVVSQHGDGTTVEATIPCE
jgi:signal transduction histidine kinase